MGVLSTFSSFLSRICDRRTRMRRNDHISYTGQYRTCQSVFGLCVHPWDRGHLLPVAEHYRASCFVREGKTALALAPCTIPGIPSPGHAERSVQLSAFPPHTGRVPTPGARPVCCFFSARCFRHTSFDSRSEKPLRIGSFCWSARAARDDKNGVPTLPLPSSHPPPDVPVVDGFSFMRMHVRACGGRPAKRVQRAARVRAWNVWLSDRQSSVTP